MSSVRAVQSSAAVFEVGEGRETWRPQHSFFFLVSVPSTWKDLTKLIHIYVCYMLEWELIGDLFSICEDLARSFAWFISECRLQDLLIKMRITMPAWPALQGVRKREGWRLIVLLYVFV